MPIAKEALTALTTGMPVRPYFIWGTSRFYTAKKGRCWWKIDQLANEKLVTMKDNNALAGTHKGVFDDGKLSALPSSRRLLNENKLVDSMPFVDDTENIGALEKMIRDISYGMKKGCDSAKNLMNEIGSMNFKRLTGLHHMKCNEKDAKAAGFSAAEPMPDGNHFFSISRAAMSEMRKRVAKLKAKLKAKNAPATSTQLWVKQLSPDQEQAFKDHDDTGNKAADEQYDPYDPAPGHWAPKKADDDIERVPDEPQTQAADPPEKAVTVQTSDSKKTVHTTGKTMDSEVSSLPDHSVPSSPSRLGWSCIPDIALVGPFPVGGSFPGLPLLLWLPFHVFHGCSQDSRRESVPQRQVHQGVYWGEGKEARSHFHHRADRQMRITSLPGNASPVVATRCSDFLMASVLPGPRRHVRLSEEGLQGNERRPVLTVSRTEFPRWPVLPISSLGCF